MKGLNRLFAKLVAAVVFGMVFLSSVLIAGEPASKLGVLKAPAAKHHVGMVDDWSHHRLVFSNPGTYEQAIKKGWYSSEYSKWIKLRYDTRFIMQQTKRGAAAQQMSPSLPLATMRLAGPKSPLRPPPPKIKTTIHADWSMNMGSGAAVGAGMYPAKYSFDIATAYCDSDPTPDFVVYPTGLTGVAASRSGTFAGNPVATETVTIAGTLILTASATDNTGLNFITTGNKAAHALNLAAAIARNGAGVGVTATNSGNDVIVTALTPGTAGNGITLVEGLTGFAWDAGTLAGGTDQANIIAYDNLYSGCSGANKPLVYWQYGTDGGTIVTSPVLSADGSQVAFAQSVGGVARLVLLKWSKDSNLVNLTNTAAASYRACTAPCMTSLTFNGSPDDTNSSPFYDYTNDVLYVGDDSGVLHKFTNIFNSGTPAEITGGGAASGWPQQVNAGGRVLTSPVYDSVSGKVFVGSGTDTWGRRLHSIPAAGGSDNVASSSSLAGSASTGVVDAPLVDSAAGTVYVFTNDDDGTHGAVYQFAVGFADGGGATTKQTLGQNSDNEIAYSGTFDNLYFTSSDASPTGNLYVCGRATGTQRPTLYQVPIASNVLGTPVIGPELVSGGTPTCSPVVEILNGSTDRIFLSVQANNKTAAPISCPAGTGCIMSFDVTTATGFGTGKTTSSTLGAAGGTSGIIIDNTVGSGTLAGASQVYYSTLSDQACVGNGSTGSGTGGCAVQASQANLN